MPGAWELPLAVKKLALALGAVTCFDYVAAEASKGIASIGLEQRVPVLFGVLTCNTLEQALIRTGSKGANCAMSAIEMANLMRNIRTGNTGVNSMVC